MQEIKNIYDLCINYYNEKRLFPNAMKYKTLSSYMLEYEIAYDEYMSTYQWSKF